MGKYAPKIPQFKPERQNLYIAISPQLLIRRTSDLKTTLRPRKGTSWVVRHYPKENTKWLTAAIFKIDMTSHFRCASSDLDDIRHPDAEQHADYDEMVQIITRSRTPT